MMAHTNLFARLRSDQNGAMLIETALVTPVLVLMSLGAYQVSGIVARQTELESAAAEAAAIALASKPDTPTERTTLANVISASTGLPAATGSGGVSSSPNGSSQGVAVTEAYRCGSATTMISDKASCTSGHLSSFVTITLTDTYTPPWAHYGVGSPINYEVTRQVMFQQDELD